MTKLPTKLLSTGAQLPEYGSEQAAGMDLHADLTQGDADIITLEPGQRALIKTGVSVKIEPGFYGRVAPRSGLAYKHGIDVMAGVIDSDYRGDVGVILINHGDEDFQVFHGDRIAQMIITPHATSFPHLVNNLDDTSRGDGGFGSTGV